MHFLDVAILVILGAFVVIGFTRGIVRQIGFIIGFVVSLILARRYYDEVAFYIRPSLEDWPFIAEPLAAVLGFFLVYFTVGFVFHIIVRILDSLVNVFKFIPFLKATNRFAGAAVGFVEGVLLSAAILYIVSIIPVDQIRDSIRQSRLAPSLVRVAVILKPLLPDFSSIAPQGPQPLDIDEFERQLERIQSGAKDVRQLNSDYVQKKLKEYNIETKGLEKIPALAPQIFNDAVTETKNILDATQQKFAPKENKKK